jgi:HSP20 family molecular chaperone IbpA
MSGFARVDGLKKFGESAAKSVLERIGRGVSRVQERKPLPYDLLESDDAYLVVFDAPGAQRSDVQVRFLEGEVQVQIDRFRDFHEGFDMRFPGRGLTLDGSATLPGDAAVDATEATATLASNGTLRVRIPKDDSVRDVEVTEAEDEADGASASEGGGDDDTDEGGEDDTNEDEGGEDDDADDEDDEYEPTAVEETVAESEGETVEADDPETGGKDSA